MPRPLRYMLVTDGPSDACLKYPIEWLLREHGWQQVEGEWADLRQLPESARTLVERLDLALRYYTAEIMFVHRDAEVEPRIKRLDEIEHAMAALNEPLRWVAVVPVRMTETWLLHDQSAIRRAAGRPNGIARLEIPAVRQLEGLADPKSVLRDALVIASETTGQRRKRAVRDFGIMRYRVAELIDDFAPLRLLDAFSCFERDLEQLLGRL